MNREALYDRIAGCLMAGALGDALGYEVEFLPWPIIQRKYGRVEKLVLHGGKAQISDDTQMTLFTNEGLVLGYWQEKQAPSGRDAVYYLHQAYLCWLRTQWDKTPSTLENESELLKEPEMNEPRAPGNTCLAALRSGEMGTLEEPINRSKGCGGVMRSAPAGFTDAWGEPLRLGAVSAAITHGHPGAWLPAGMLSDIVYRCIYFEKKPLEDIILDSLRAVKAAWNIPETGPFADLILDAVYLSKSDRGDLEAIRELGEGWVGDEALAIAVYSCLRYPDSIPGALACAVNHSGDSDSTGAIAGNILGAYLGLGAAPKDWIDQLELVGTILRQAERMTEVAMDARAGQED